MANRLACLRRIAVRLHLARPESLEAQRLRAALDMRDFGVGMYRQRMYREHPGASEDEISALVWAWLLEQPQDRTLPSPPERPENDDH